MSECQKPQAYAGVRNLLFDLGGVIMDIDRGRCLRSLTRMGMPRRAADDMLGVYVQRGIFMQLESGLIGVDEFYAGLRALFPDGAAGYSDKQLESALCDFLIGIPVFRLASLRRLRERFGVYMLSNTNPIMMSTKIAGCFRAEGLEMGDYFDGMVMSYKAKAMKPGRAIFDYAVSELGIIPRETLFFDDSQANLDAAASLGFQVALVPPGSEFEDITSGL